MLIAFALLAADPVVDAERLVALFERICLPMTAKGLSGHAAAEAASRDPDLVRFPSYHDIAGFGLRDGGATIAIRSLPGAERCAVEASADLFDGVLSRSRRYTHGLRATDREASFVQWRGAHAVQLWHTTSFKNHNTQLALTKPVAAAKPR